MSKLTVNIGTSANDRTGDSLRTAFNKINENFTELYTALGLGDGSLNLGSFEFNGSTITTTDSSGVIIDQALSVTGTLSVNGELQITKHSDSTLPVDTNNVEGWIEITIDGQISYLPYYR
jgi:hypothetical protein